MACLDLLDLLDHVVALEKWDLLVLLVFLDPQALQDQPVPVSPSCPCHSRRRVPILSVEATEPMTPAFVTATLRSTPVLNL